MDRVVKEGLLGGAIAYPILAAGAVYRWKIAETFFEALTDKTVINSTLLYAGMITSVKLGVDLTPRLYQYIKERI